MLRKLHFQLLILILSRQAHVGSAAVEVVERLAMNCRDAWVPQISVSSAFLLLSSFSFLLLILLRIASTSFLKAQTLQYLQHDALQVFHDGLHNSNPSNTNALLQLYIIENKVYISTLQNSTLDYTRSIDCKYNFWPRQVFVQYAYERTGNTSSSKYALSSIYYGITSSCNKSFWPTDKLGRLFQKLPLFVADYVDLQRVGPASDPRVKGGCLYHAKGDPRPSK